MKLKQVLDLLDHEVWVRVRPNGDDKRDVVFWSADWLMHCQPKSARTRRASRGPSRPWSW